MLNVCMNKDYTYIYQKPLILSLRARFVKNFNKCLEHDNNVVKSVAFICKSNPMSCAGNVQNVVKC